MHQQGAKMKRYRIQGQRNLSHPVLLASVVVLLLWPTTGPGLAQQPEADRALQPLAFGETETGFISVPAEVDAFAFVADAGDVILIGTSRSSGNLWPRIRLYQPGGQLLLDEYDPVHAEATLVMPVPGTYSVQLSDGFDGTLTGGYGLYLQRLNAPGNTTPLAFGETATGFISQAAEMDSYTFDAEESDAILVGISQASGDLWPQIRVYDPRGNLVGINGDPVHAEITLAVSKRWVSFLPLVARSSGGTAEPVEPSDRQARGILVRASFPGTYTILVADDLDGTLSGGYGLHLQRLNNPGNATAIGFGETLAGSINQAAEMDAYTFAASAGDTVLIGASKASGDLWPQVRLFDPAGNPVGVAGQATHAEVQAVLASSGTYTLLIADDLNGTLTGGYGLHLQRLNNPGNATALAYGDLVAATISMAAEMDAYTFAAGAGDAIRVSMARTSGSLWPQIRLFDPDGATVGIAGGASSAELNATLTESGTYAILAADDLNGTLTGGYDLQLQKTSR
jgi:hypothetical protein